MNELKLCLFVFCILLESKLNFCAPISNTVDILEDSISSVSSPEVQHFPKKLSSSLKHFRDHQVKNDINAMEPSNKNDFEKMKSTVSKAITNIDHSKSIDDMIKTVQQFPIYILNEKQVQPMCNKLKKEFSNVVAKGTTVLQMARKLEKIGNKKTEKQVVQFNAKLKNLDKLVRKFTKKFNVESRKERNRNLKIAKNHPNDVNLFRSAKRNINMIDLLKDLIGFLEGFPDKIKCLIHGNCDKDTNSEEDNEYNSDAADEEENSEYEEEYDEEF